MPVAPIAKKQVDQAVIPSSQEISWENLNKFLAENNDILFTGNLSSQVIQPKWLSAAFTAITKDLFVLLSIPQSGNPKKDIQKKANTSSNEYFKNKTYEPYVIELLFNKVQDKISTLSTDQNGKNRYSERALTQLIDKLVNSLYNTANERESRANQLKNLTTILLPQTTTEIPLFTNSKPNMPAILASAKALKAESITSAMAQLQFTLEAANKEAWKNNEEAIKNYLEFNWQNN